MGPITCGQVSMAISVNWNSVNGKSVLTFNSHVSASLWITNWKKKDNLTNTLYADKRRPGGWRKRNTEIKSVVGWEREWAREQEEGEGCEQMQSVEECSEKTRLHTLVCLDSRTLSDYLAALGCNILDHIYSTNLQQCDLPLAFTQRLEKRSRTSQKIQVCICSS